MSFLIFLAGLRENRGQHAIFTGRNTSTGGTGDSGVSTGGANWVPLETLLKTINRKVTAALTAGSSISHRYKKDTNVAVSGIETITAPATIVTDAVEGLLPAIDPASAVTVAATLNNINEWPSTAPTPGVGTCYYGHQYEVPSNPRVSWYSNGSDFSAGSFGASVVYAAVGEESFVSSSTVQARRQVPWPLAGTFQHVAISWAGLDVGTTIQMCLQKNGVDTALVFNLSGAGVTRQGLLNVVLSAHFDAGDLVNWRLTRTAGSDTTATLSWTIGFRAD